MSSGSFDGERAGSNPDGVRDHDREQHHRQHGRHAGDAEAVPGQLAEARGSGGSPGSDNASLPSSSTGNAKPITIGAACAAPIVIGFALPVLLLGRLALSEPGLPGAARFGELAWNSFRVAGMTAALAVLFAIVIAYAVRIAPGALTHGTSRLLTLGYAAPGTVLAVGVLLPLGAIDATLAAFAEREFGVRTGLILTGTIVALIYAYLVRYFAVAWNGVEPAFARITPNMDAAARGLGAGTARHAAARARAAPRRTAAAATLLVFVDVMKELPATLVLRPFNFDTLATRTYTLAQDERLAEAALPSLAIVAVGVLPLLVPAARRAAGHRRPKARTAARDHVSAR